MKNRCLVTALVVSCFFATPVLAESVTQDAVIVTATRTAQTADETLASVTVLTREDIERRQAQSIADLLRGEPGLTITNNGGSGKATSVFLRGTQSDHVLVLVDGVKVGSATLGTTAFQDVPVEQIERIEIVRGPRSSLYGSEAIGGMIQIFTRRGGGPVRPYLSLGGGSHDTYDGLVGVSGGGDRGWFNVSASHFGTQGINACDGKPSPGGAGCFTIEPDRDGYRNTAGHLRGGYRFDNGAEADLNWLRAESDNQFDGGSQNESKSMQEVVGSRLRFSPVAPWHVTLAAGRSRDESDNHKDGVFSSRFDTERDTASFQNDVAIGTAQLLTAGLDYQEDRVVSTTAYTVTSRNNKGLFAQYQAGFGRQDVQASLRSDDNEQFGHFTTGGAAWGYNLGNGRRFTASYGTAFKAPTFNQLYFPGFGNPNLHPEKSRSLEAGLSGRFPAGRWSAHTFQTRITDLIGFDATTSPSNASARIRGVEVETAIPVADWDTRLNLTLQDPENRSNTANQGKRLNRRASESLSLELDRDFGAWRLGATLRAEGERYDDLANTLRLGGYATVDLRGEYAFARDWSLAARVANLFDKDYETAAFFNQEGRSYYFTLRYQP